MLYLTSCPAELLEIWKKYDGDSTKGASLDLSCVILHAGGKEGGPDDRDGLDQGPEGCKQVLRLSEACRTS